MASLEKPPVDVPIVTPKTGQLTDRWSFWMSRLHARIGGVLGGFAPDTATYITKTPSSELGSEQALSLLSTGYARVTTGSGVISTTSTLPASDITGTLGVAFGGTGVTTLGDLTKVDDTNITLTLGGTPTGAVITSTSITAGWAGQLSLTRGGTGASLIADNGAIAYSDASSINLLASTGTAGKILQSGSSSAPTWSTPTYPSSSGTSGKIIFSDGTNNIYSTPTFPNASATAGKKIQSDGTNWVASTSIWPTTSTQGDIIYSDASNSFTLLAKNASATRYLSNQGTNNNPSWNQVDLSNGVTGDLPFANLTQGSARSVLGVTGNSTADVASIQGTTNQVLIVNSAGTALNFSTTLTSITLVSPNLGTPTAGALTNCTALPEASIVGTAWSTFTPTCTGFTGTPTTEGRYKIIGKICHVYISVSGTSNTTAFTITNLPATAANTTTDPIFQIGQAVNNSAAVASATLAQITHNSTTITFYTTTAGGAWTASGTKGVNISLMYETT